LTVNQKVGSEKVCDGTLFLSIIACMARKVDGLEFDGVVWEYDYDEIIVRITGGVIFGASVSQWVVLTAELIHDG